MRCETCLAWLAPRDLKKLPGETLSGAQIRHMNAGRPLPKGTCHRFPQVAAKDGDDWCLEWREGKHAEQSGHADTGKPE